MQHDGIITTTSLKISEKNTSAFVTLSMMCWLAGAETCLAVHSASGSPAAGMLCVGSEALPLCNARRPPPPPGEMTSARDVDGAHHVLPLSSQTAILLLRAGGWWWAWGQGTFDGGCRDWPKQETHWLSLKVNSTPSPLCCNALLGFLHDKKWRRCPWWWSSGPRQVSSSNFESFTAPTVDCSQQIRKKQKEKDCHSRNALTY